MNLGFEYAIHTAAIAVVDRVVLPDKDFNVTLAWPLEFEPCVGVAMTRGYLFQFTHCAPQVEVLMIVAFGISGERADGNFRSTCVRRQQQHKSDCPGK